MTGNLFVAKTPEVFVHDADGNLTEDGRWIYAWDAENRLRSMTARTNAPAWSSNRVEFEYDPQGRRVRKVASVFTNGAWAVRLSERYLYDGWNLVTVVGETNRTRVRSFLWGTDLSGSQQGAGGVGGLLAVKDEDGTDYFVGMDGNGNVSVLVHGTTAAVSATYEYGPFGEVVRGSGAMARKNPFRFSTKYQDDETDLLYYGYRYYSASLGRWPSRDPIGEKGGIPLYCTVANDPVNKLDRLGLDYYVAIVEGFSGVEHRVIYGDDGNGRHFRLEFYPNETTSFTPYRRLCSLGQFKYWPGVLHSAQDAIAEDSVSKTPSIVAVEKSVVTTKEEDLLFAAAAASLSNLRVMYCVGLNDCRDAEDAMISRKKQLETLRNAIRDAFENIITDALKGLSK